MKHADTFGIYFESDNLKKTLLPPGLKKIAINYRIIFNMTVPKITLFEMFILVTTPSQYDGKIRNLSAYIGTDLYFKPVLLHRNTYYAKRTTISGLL